jgi:hypothetical protein
LPQWLHFNDKSLGLTTGFFEAAGIIPHSLCLKLCT